MARSRSPREHYWLSRQQSIRRARGVPEALSSDRAPLEDTASDCRAMLKS